MNRIFAVILLSVAWSPAQTNVQAWYAGGQVWVVWDDASGGTADYSVYASTGDLTVAGTVAGASLVGRMLPPDYTAAQLRIGNPAARFRIPDGAGGTYIVNTPQQGVYAYTPTAAGTMDFAVVVTGDTAVTAANACGLTAYVYAPVNDPVRCHLQDLRMTSMGQTMRVYAHWIHGADPAVAPRPDCPVMGSAAFNGTPHVFAVTEPTTGVPANPAPLVCAFHGGGGNWWKYTPDRSPELVMHLTDAYHVAFDQNVSTLAGVITTAWLGYREDYDRYAAVPPHPVPNGTVVGDYTHRRVMWELDWILANTPVDPARVAITGHSAGSRGSGMISRLHPERFSAVINHCPHLEPSPQSPLMGDAAQNLPTTLGHGVADLFTRTTRLSATQRDIPLTRLFSGRLDTVGGAAWNAQQVQAYRDLDAGGLGYHLFWDRRTHSLGSFPGNHWGTSTYHAATSLTRFRNDVSFPGIFGFDAAPGAPDRLPDPGDGTLATGSNAGTWGGWVDWDDATLLDSAAEWSCNLWLVTQSANPADNFAAGAATSHLCIRRPQGFVPSAGEGLVWDLVRVADGALLQSGSVVVGTDEVVTVNDVALLPEPGVRLRVRTCAPAYPGTGEDLVLLTGINGAINGCHRKIAQAGDLFDLQVASPAGGFNFATLVVYAQPFATGGPPPMTVGFPGLWIDLLAPRYAVFDGIGNPLGGGLDPAGFSFGPIVVGPAFAGQSVMIQGGVLSPGAANGLYATTAGHELVVQ